MKIKYGIQMGIVLFFIVMSQGLAANMTDSYLGQARRAVKEGDLKSAIALYQKALTIDEHKATARKELSELIIKYQMSEPYAENNDEILL